MRWWPPLCGGAHNGVCSHLECAQPGEAVLLETSESAAAEQRYPVEFSATAGEYFRIWIVNLALTLVTLGIYSAWAKVRKKRYFYAHTQIGGEGFEYRGNPIAILKGRIVAVLLLAVYAFSGQMSGLLQLVLGLVFAFAFPWLLVRSLAFNAHNSAYRNIRFHFGATYLDALKVLALCAALVLITVGIAYPYARARLTRFGADYHQYGTAQFALPSLTGTFYGIYLRLVGMTLLLLLLVVLLAALGAVALVGLGVDPRGGAAGMLMVAATPIGMLGVYLLWLAYPRARIGNAVWNNLAIGKTEQGDPRVRFDCRLRARDLAWLYLVNVGAIILTLGLATPWAVVRTLRYRAGKMALQVAGGLDQFVAAQSAEVGASGEAVGEMFGLDFSF